MVLAALGEDCTSDAFVVVPGAEKPSPGQLIGVHRPPGRYTVAQSAQNHCFCKVSAPTMPKSIVFVRSGRLPPPVARILLNHKNLKNLKHLKNLKNLKVFKIFKILKIFMIQ